MYDLAIIGGGPAGVAAGVYAARKKLKTILIAETVGGQSTDSPDVQNWIGTPHISGMEMAKQLEKHLREYASDVLELKIGERAAVSIPANLAEGYARKHRAEYAQFVKIAFGSGAELETHLLIAQNLGFVSKKDSIEAEALLDEVMRMLNKLSASLAAKP